MVSTIVYFPDAFCVQEITDNWQTARRMPKQFLVHIIIRTSTAHITARKNFNLKMVARLCIISRGLTLHGRMWRSSLLNITLTNVLRCVGIKLGYGKRTINLKNRKGFHGYSRSVLTIYRNAYFRSILFFQNKFCQSFPDFFNVLLEFQ